MRAVHTYNLPPNVPTINPLLLSTYPIPGAVLKDWGVSVCEEFIFLWNETDNSQHTTSKNKKLCMMYWVLLACNLGSCTRPHAQKGPQVGLMLCCLYLKILNHVWRGDSVFSFCPGPCQLWNLSWLQEGREMTVTKGDWEPWEKSRGGLQWEEMVQRACFRRQ